MASRLGHLRKCASGDICRIESSGEAATVLRPTKVRSIKPILQYFWQRIASRDSLDHHGPIPHQACPSQLSSLWGLYLLPRPELMFDDRFLISLAELILRTSDESGHSVSQLPVHCLAWSTEYKHPKARTKNTRSKENVRITRRSESPPKRV